VNSKNAFAQNFVRREQTREEKCKQAAEKVFRAFEENFPKELRLEALRRQETFEKLLSRTGAAVTQPRRCCPKRSEC
jgi:hypothetical protein